MNYILQSKKLKEPVWPRAEVGGRRSNTMKTSDHMHLLLRGWGGHCLCTVDNEFYNPQRTCFSLEYLYGSDVILLISYILRPLFSSSVSSDLLSFRSSSAG